MDTSTNSAQPVFPGAAFASHMPFLRGDTLLFCQAKPPEPQTFRRGGAIWQRMGSDPKFKARFADLPRTTTLSFRRWKLSAMEWPGGQPRRIITGLPEDAVECNPSFHLSDGGCHVLFVGGIMTPQRIVYRLYQMSGPSLDRLVPASPVSNLSTRVGFVSPTYVCTGQGPTLHFQNRQDGSRFVLVTPLARIQQANYQADDEQSIIIMGQTRERTDAVLIHQVATGETCVVSAPEGVYKASLDAGRIVFARRYPGATEDRDLWHGTASLARGRRCPTRWLEKCAQSPSSELDLKGCTMLTTSMYVVDAFVSGSGSSNDMTGFLGVSGIANPQYSNVYWQLLDIDYGYIYDTGPVAADGTLEVVNPWEDADFARRPALRANGPRDSASYPFVDDYGYPGYMQLQVFYNPPPPPPKPCRGKCCGNAGGPGAGGPGGPGVPPGESPGDLAAA